MWYFLVLSLLALCGLLVWDIRRIRRELAKPCCGVRHRVNQNDIETEIMAKPISQNDIDTRIM